MFTAVRVTDLRGRRVGAKLPIDATVRIFVNGEMVSLFQASPHMLEELALGFIYGERIVSRVEDVEAVSVTGRNVHVTLKDSQGAVRGEAKAVTTECALPGGEGAAEPVTGPSRHLKASEIAHIIRDFNKRAGPRLEGWSLHSAAIYDEGLNAVVCVSDVSRQAALDKALGWLLRSGRRGIVCVTTGRPTGSMVSHVARAGIPLLLSLKGPLYTGYEAADRLGITLVSVVRGLGPVVLTHHRRVIPG